MALEGGSGSSNLVRAGGAFVEVTAKDNTKAGLDSAAKNLDALDKKAKGVGGPAGQAQLNNEAVKTQELAKQGARLTLLNRNAAEKFADTQRELNQLLQAGAISQLTFGRAGKKAAEELATARKAAGLDTASALGLGGIGARLGGAIGPAALTAGLLQAGSASGSEIAELRSPERARAMRQLGFGIERGQMQAELGGFPAQQAFAATLKQQADEARKAWENLIAKGRVSVGGQTLFNVSDLPGGVGTVRTEEIANAKTKMEQLAQAAGAYAEELDRAKLTLALATKEFATATNTMGMNPERGALFRAMQDKRPQYEIDQLKRNAENRELARSSLAGRDLWRAFGLQAQTTGLPPEAAAIAAAAQNMRLNENRSPQDIAIALAQAVPAGEIALQKRFGQQREDFLYQNAQSLRDQKELEKLASPLREEAFKGQLGVRGGYDYGGGGQWREEMKSTAQEARDLQRQQLMEQQALRRITEDEARELKKFRDSLKFK